MTDVVRIVWQKVSIAGGEIAAPLLLCPLPLTRAHFAAKAARRTHRAHLLPSAIVRNCVCVCDCVCPGGVQAIIKSPRNGGHCSTMRSYFIDRVLSPLCPAQQNWQPFDSCSVFVGAVACFAHIHIPLCGIRSAIAPPTLAPFIVRDRHRIV